MSNNEAIRIEGIYSEIDVRKKTGQLFAKIDEANSQISTALSKVKSLKEKSREKHNAGWSIGGKDKRLAIEALQAVTRDVADSQVEIIQIQKNIVEGQKMLNQHTTILYQLGAMSLAANRIVHRELKLKLENASREELSDLARQELLNTIRQIEQMQDTLILQEKQKVQLNQQSEQISKLKKDNDRLRLDMAESDGRFSTLLDSQSREISELNSVYQRLRRGIAQHEEKNSRDITELKENIHQQAIHLEQDRELISKLKEDIVFLVSEISKVESKYALQEETQKNNILELRNTLHVLGNKIDELSKRQQNDNNYIKENMELLEKSSYSKNRVWLMVVLSLLLSVIVSVTGVMCFFQFN
ncbi:MAG: hypothetical protein K2K94_03335 [Muribaculaceae bacterium]|nr:hypothetical protein [Muribaculaceae bacterium]